MQLTPPLLKLALNLWPPYLGAGIRIEHIDPQWRELRVGMKLRRFNRNIAGTQFGGSLYAMVDPHLLLLLMHRLGPDYWVWDQSARIHYHKPGLSKVHCYIAVSDEQLAEIRAGTAGGHALRPEFKLEIRDDAGQLIADVHKQLYVRLKKERRPQR